MYEEELTWPSYVTALLILPGPILTTIILAVILLSPAASRPQATVEWIALASGPVLMVIICGAVIVAFRRLRITRDSQSLTVGFGPIRRSIPLDDIVGCRTVTYRWRDWGGWGIRWRPWDRAILYNVPGDGRQAVEVTLRDGRRVLFSSRDPEGACNAIGVGAERT